MTNPNDPITSDFVRVNELDPLAGPYKVIGLTKREYFAALAMQGILASPRDMAIRKDETCDDCIVRLSAVYADKLIKRLNKDTPNV